ncbi:hypothetical protein D3C86_1603500 [compost metagenome]
MAVRPDFRAYACLADKGVVARHFAVRVQTHHFALQLVEVLRGRALVVFAQSDEQITVAVEHQARAEMYAAGQLRQLPEDHLETFQPALIRRQLGAPDRGAGVLAVTGLGIGQVNPAVRGKLGRQGHIEQPALASGINSRHALDRLGQFALQADQAQTSGPLGDQQTLPIGQKGQAPGMLQPGDQLADLQAAVFAGVFADLRASRRHQQHGGQAQNRRYGCAQHASLLHGG